MSEGIGTINPNARSPIPLNHLDVGKIDPNSPAFGAFAPNESIMKAISWEIYIPYAGEVGILLLRWGKFIISKLKSSRLS